MKIIKNVSITTLILDDGKNSFFTMSGKTFLPRSPYWLHYLMTIVLLMKTDSI